MQETLVFRSRAINCSSLNRPHGRRVHQSRTLRFKELQIRKLRTPVATALLDQIGYASLLSEMPVQFCATPLPAISVQHQEMFRKNDLQVHPARPARSNIQPVRSFLDHQVRVTRRLQLCRQSRPIPVLKTGNSPLTMWLTGNTGSNVESKASIKQLHLRIRRQL